MTKYHGEMRFTDAQNRLTCAPRPAAAQRCRRAATPPCRRHCCYCCCPPGHPLLTPMLTPRAPLPSFCPRSCDVQVDPHRKGLVSKILRKGRHKQHDAVCYSDLRSLRCAALR